MKSLQLLVKKHNYQYLILASLILAACHRSSVSHVIKGSKNIVINELTYISQNNKYTSLKSSDRSLESLNTP